MDEKYTYIGSVYLLLIENGKVLLLRRANTGFEDGKYGLPAGHLDGNETVREGMIREAREEIGSTLEANNLTLVHVMHRRKRNHEQTERLDFFFTTKTYTGEIKNCEPDKCDDLSWFPLDALPDNTIKYVSLAIKRVQNGEIYSEYGWGDRL